MQCFLGCSSLLLYVLSAINGLITSRSLGLLRVSWASLVVGAFANWASGAAMHRKITRQSRWNLRRVSDRAIPNQAPGSVGEGVETGWRASHVDEGTVRLSSKGESDRITQRSVVQIHPPATKNPFLFSNIHEPRN